MIDYKVGIVIPTMGLRTEYLKEAIMSVRNAGRCFILIVTPNPILLEESGLDELVEQIENDRGSGLTESINLGISALPQSVEFVNWLGDDDRLSPDSITLTSNFLLRNPSVDCVFGRCSLIDEHGRVLWHNRSGSWATWFMRFGPCLIPQPGALFRRSSFERIGELNPGYNYAFDLDLWIRFSTTGKMSFLDAHLGDFRWHSDSKTVSNRIASIKESEQVRTSHQSKFSQLISPIWEIPLSYFSVMAGKMISRRIKTSRA